MHTHYGKCYKGNVHSTLKLNRKKYLINFGAQGITFMMRQMVKMDKPNEGWKGEKDPGRGSSMCKVPESGSNWDVPGTRRRVYVAEGQEMRLMREAQAKSFRT